MPNTLTINVDTGTCGNYDCSGCYELERTGCTWLGVKGDCVAFLSCRSVPQVQWLLEVGVSDGETPPRPQVGSLCMWTLDHTEQDVSPVGWYDYDSGTCSACEPDPIEVEEGALCPSESPSPSWSPSPSPSLSPSPSPSPSPAPSASPSASPSPEPPECPTEGYCDAECSYNLSLQMGTGFTGGSGACTCSNLDNESTTLTRGGCVWSGMISNWNVTVFCVDSVWRMELTCILTGPAVYYTAANVDGCPPAGAWSLESTACTAAGSATISRL